MPYLPTRCRYCKLHVTERCVFQCGINKHRSTVSLQVLCLHWVVLHLYCVNPNLVLPRWKVIQVFSFHVTLLDKTVHISDCILCTSLLYQITYCTVQCTAQWTAQYTHTHTSTVWHCCCTYSSTIISSFLPCKLTVKMIYCIPFLNFINCHYLLSCLCLLPPLQCTWVPLTILFHLSWHVLKISRCLYWLSFLVRAEFICTVYKVL